tara:strand:+ start:213 stop:563 length:351 start_codon:yes stop_codon:yes gene_type:complete
MAFKMKSGNNPAFNMMGAESPKKMKSPMDKELVGNQDRLPEELKAKIEASPEKMKAPMDMKTPMELEMEKDSAMQLKSAMDMAKDGPMEMGHSPKKLTTDAAMKMAAAMKKFYNKD